MSESSFGVPGFSDQRESAEILRSFSLALGTISSPILQPHAPTWARECFRGMAPTLESQGDGWDWLVGAPRFYPDWRIWNPAGVSSMGTSL